MTPDQKLAAAARLLDMARRLLDGVVAQRDGLPVATVIEVAEAREYVERALKCAASARVEMEERVA